MATIIEALIVTLGLDTSGFQKGQKGNEADQKRLRDEAEKTGKTFEAQGKKMADSVAAVRDQVIGMLAVFTAGTGIKDFIAALTTADAALGRNAANIGISANELSAWQGVASRAGGSAQSITGSMRALSQGFVQLALTGQSQALPYFRALGVQISDFVDQRGNVRDMNGLLLSISDAFHKKGLTGAQAQSIGAGLGLDEATINLLMRSRAELEGLQAEMRNYAATQADVAAAQQRQDAFSVLGSAATELGRTLVTLATPAILAVTKAVTKFYDFLLAHQDVATALFYGLAAAATAFSIALAGPILGVAELAVEIGAAMAGIALLYDDWKTWIRGGKAEFGEFWQFFSDAWKTIQTDILPYIIEFGRQVGDTLDLITSLFFGSSDDIRANWKQLSKDLADDIAGLVKAIDTAMPDMQTSIVNALGKFIDASKFLLVGFVKDAEWIAHRVNAMINAITSALGLGKFLKEEGSILDEKPTQGAQNSVSAPFSDQSSAKAQAGVKQVAEQAEKDIAFYVGKGWTRPQSAGIVANLYRESNGGHADAVGDNGAAYGLGQWHKPRQDSFAKWAGHDIRQSTRDEQLAFVDWELRNGGSQEKLAGSMLGKATSADQAGSIISKYYERPAAQSAEAAQRAALASALANSSEIGAGTVAQMSVTHNNSQDSNSTASTVEIGSITVNGAGISDAGTFAQTVGNQIRANNWARAANTGLTG